MTFKKFLSIATVGLVLVLIFLSRGELAKAWGHLGEMNLWILALLVPVQVLMYFFAGQIYFSYIKAKGQLGHMSWLKLARISLEMNFVNHIIPSGGVSGLGYLAWRLRSHGITAGQATIMQVVRYAMAALSTMSLMLICSVWLIFLGVPFLTILLSVGIALSLLVAVLVTMFVLDHERRVDGFGKGLGRVSNHVIKVLTFGRVRMLVRQKSIDKFLVDLHRDYKAIMKDWKILIKPFAWAVAYSFFEPLTFYVSFMALGAEVSFAPVMIGQGIASIVGTLTVVPGGAGLYEVAMASYFIATGIDPVIAITATVVTRVVVLLGTIISGWGFYQIALAKDSGQDGFKKTRRASR
jgi:uncharacterized protein (TIRG00374 family)